MDETAFRERTAAWDRIEAKLLRMDATLQRIIRRYKWQRAHAIIALVTVATASVACLAFVFCTVAPK